MIRKSVQRFSETDHAQTRTNKRGSHDSPHFGKKAVSVGEALRGRVAERTEEVLRKYFDGNFSGHITLSKDGFGSAPTARCILIPALPWRPIRTRRTPMPAPTRRS